MAGGSHSCFNDRVSVAMVMRSDGKGRAREGVICGNCRLGTTKRLQVRVIHRQRCGSLTSAPRVLEVWFPGDSTGTADTPTAS